MKQVREKYSDYSVKITIDIRLMTLVIIYYAEALLHIKETHN